jgi:hypothetical protein
MYESGARAAAVGSVQHSTDSRLRSRSDGGVCAVVADFFRGAYECLDIPRKADEFQMSKGVVKHPIIQKKKKEENISTIKPKWDLGESNPVLLLHTISCRKSRESSYAPYTRSHYFF